MNYKSDNFLNWHLVPKNEFSIILVLLSVYILDTQHFMFMAHCNSSDLSVDFL